MAADSIDCCRTRGPSRRAELVDSNLVGKLTLWRCRRKRLRPKKRCHGCHRHHRPVVVGTVGQRYPFLNGSREKRGARKDRNSMKTEWKDWTTEEADGGG